MTDAALASEPAEFDLIVVGSGAAGLSAAVTAAVSGASVLVLEKTDLIGGTTALSGGVVWAPVNRHMAEVGVEDTAEEALTYLRACVGQHGDDGHLTTLVTESAAAVARIEDWAGFRFQPWPSYGGTMDYRGWLPGAKHGGRSLSTPNFDVTALGEWAARLRGVEKYAGTMDPIRYYAELLHLQAPGPQAVPLRSDDREPSTEVSSGAALAGRLLLACLNNGVELRTQAKVERLVHDDRRVTGVGATVEGRPVRFGARYGVHIATGGFAHNEELKRLWLRRPLEFSCEMEDNQGDGHLLGMAVGAQVAGLGDAWWMPQTPMGSETTVLNAAGSREDRVLPHTMLVNAGGERFVNEGLNYYDSGETFGQKISGLRSNYPAWLLFDQQGVDRYALLAWKVPEEGGTPGIHVAPDLDELARLISVPAAVLRASVERFNGFARSGLDEDFHRGEGSYDTAWGDPSNTPNPCLGTLEKGPFYAVEVRTGALATRGGLRVDDRGRVIGVDGTVIDGLYAAGNCSNGGAVGVYAGAGATIGGAMTFGYVVGREIARLRSEAGF